MDETTSQRPAKWDDVDYLSWGISSIVVALLCLPFVLDAGVLWWGLCVAWAALGVLWSVIGVYLKGVRIGQRRY